MIAIALSLICAVGCAWIGLFILTPLNLRSLFRYRLWRLRDDIVDDVLAGRLPREPAVTSLITATESLIQNARCVTWTTWLLSPNVPEEYRLAYRAHIETSFNRLSPDQQARLSEYRKNLEACIVRQMTVGSFSGWLLGATFLTGFFIMGLVLFARRSTANPRQYAWKRLQEFHWRRNQSERPIWEKVFPRIDQDQLHAAL